jgi:DNA processing protein
MEPDLKEWVWYANLKGIATRKKVELLRIFDSPVQIYNADNIALSKTGILSKENISAILSKEYRDSVDKTIEEIYMKHIQVIPLNSSLYPNMLKNISDPPICLYVKGNLYADELSIAVVGSRRASGYGVSLAKKISSELSKFNICIVSGMARGIDSSAHMGALSVNGRTIAVLGCGLDIVYPGENKKLMDQIIENGAVISEYPPGVEPKPHHFPVRNRIVSGMSVGVLVVEAGVKSGSLITAQLALEQGRDVYALPGNVISINSQGTNKLIQDGAKLVLNAQDILDELNWFSLFDTKNVIDLNSYRNNRETFNDLDRDEQEVVELLLIESLQIDEIYKKLSIEMPLLHSVLLSLEMKGIIKRDPGGIYRIEV